MAIVTATTRGQGTATHGWSARGLYSVAFRGVAAGTQMSDRGLQSVLLAPIQHSFAVGDATIGALQGLAGVLVGSAVAVPLARVADRVSRRRVLLWLIAAWIALTALSALAPTFPLFFVGRAASGVTEFAMIPVVYSLIPDLAPARHRVAANLSFAALMAAGASAGFFFGGALVAFADGVVPLALEPWRKALLLLAVIALPLLPLGALVADPPRGVSDEADRETGGEGASLGGFLRARWGALGLFVGVAGSLMVAVQGLNLMVALALGRRFAVGPVVIGQALGTITLLTSVGCLPVAAALDRLLRDRFGTAARPLIMSIGAAAALPCAVALAVVRSVDAALAAVGLFLLLTCTANALVPTMLQDLTPATLRARSFAVWSFTVSVFCALGPLAVGALSDGMLAGDLLTAIAVVAVPALLVSAACGARAVVRGR